MSLVNTLMQPLRSEYQNRFDQKEYRDSRYGGLRAFQRGAMHPDSIFSASIKEKIERSFGNTVQVPVINYDGVTISSSRSCTILDSENTSALVTLTFVTYSFGFNMYPAQHYNNDIDRQQDFNTKLRKYLLQFAADLDTACIAQLEADKNQFWTGIGGVYYPEVADALQVSQAEKNDYYNNLESILNTMDLYDDITVVSSTSGKPLVQRLDNQGSNNGINENFQLNGYNWLFSNRVSNNVGVQSTNYAFNAPTVAIWNRNDPDAILGHSALGGGRVWDVVNAPIVDMNVASYYTEDCADASSLHAGTSGLTRTKKEGYEWSTDMVIATAYNSVPASRYGSVVKGEILTT